jgi:nitrous oxidase accessory protein
MMLGLLAVVALAGTAVAGPQARAGDRPLARIVAEAHAGDTIRIPPGTHAGPLLVDKRLVLLADAGAVLDGGGIGTVLTIRADSVVVRGLAVRSSGRSLDEDDAAIKLERCTGCRLEQIQVDDALHGIYLLRSNDVTIAGARITGPAMAESSRGNGIHLFDSRGNRLAGNRIRGTRDGIYFSFASGNEITGNDIRRVRYGLHYMYSDDNRFERNVFAENAAGAAIMFSKRIVLRENTFTRHVGYRAYGILLQTAEQVQVERNTITGNLTGVFLDGAVADVFRDNVIAANGVGIDLLASAEGNVFTGNVIVDNRQAVRKVLGTSANAWSEKGRGNYWGDASVFDLDGDGIGDRPYRVGDPFLGLAAERPALELFAGTLAARALSWADEALPVFTLARAEDPHPLARRPGTIPDSELVARPPLPPAAPLLLSFLLGALFVATVRSRRARRLA